MPAFMPASSSGNNAGPRARMKVHTMTTTTPGKPASTESGSAPARVSFVPAGTDRHRLDGAWWPRSRDLRDELPALIAALDVRFERIGHATVNNSMWPEVPRRIAIPGRILHVGWFGAEQDPHVICLLSARAGRWDLLVVPPECEPAPAARLMAAASAAHNALTASALLASAGD
jgi:Family of unknown function (DUF5994)